jgi:lactate 2-monooxygenase
MFHPLGERATSAAFGALGLPYVLSTATSTGFASVAAANGAENPRWYQLYWPSDPDLTRSYLLTAKAHGYTALEITVDTWDLGWRTRDLDRGFFPFIKGIGVQIGLEDPVAHQKLGFDATAPNATAEQKQMAALYHVITTSRGVSPMWENLGSLREIWGNGPILLKGIQTAEDAEMAVQHGMDGVVVSNVSSSPSSLLVNARADENQSTEAARSTARSRPSTHCRTSWGPSRDASPLALMAGSAPAQTCTAPLSP